MADLFTERTLRDALYPRPFRFHAQAESTMDLAAQWAGAPAGSVVVAEEQLGGRGRFARRWLTPAGTALAFSVILRPAAEALPRVVMLGAVSVLEALAPLVPAGSVTLKWPNDVQARGRKLCGVLSEAHWQGETLAAAVLGIGLNVAVPFAGTPLAETALNLCDLTDASIDRAALLAAILRRVDYWSARLASAELFAAWRDALTTLGQTVTISGGQALIGRASAVFPDGALELIDAAGTPHRIYAGEVSLRETE